MFSFPSLSFIPTPLAMNCVVFTLSIVLWYIGQRSPEQSWKSWWKSSIFLPTHKTWSLPQHYDLAILCPCFVDLQIALHMMLLNNTLN
jgi:hypothetical protein